MVKIYNNARKESVQALIYIECALPRLCTRFGERAFLHTGSLAQNILPKDIRDTSDSADFRR